MKSKIIVVSCLIIGVAIVVVLNIYLGPILISRGHKVFDDNVLPLLAAPGALKKQRPKQIISAPLPTDVSPASFSESFDTTHTVTEARALGESADPNWWLSSGAYFYSANGVGSTISGDLSALDPWRVAYFLSNPLDTDNGYHPQNIFRLVLKSQWQNFQQEAYFQITKDNLSASPNRNASNGLLFFNRYQDAFNLYYTGLRVDGAAVIKKKINGVYYTLAYKPVYGDGTAYNRDTNPDLIPSQQWIGLRSEVTTNSDNTVSLKLFIDKDKTGNWVLAAEAKDDGVTYGGAAISNEGYAGIRTDFMDAEFDDYKVVKF